MLPIRTVICAEAFRELSNGESDVERFNNLPDDAPNLSVKSFVAIKASSLLTSCSFINPDTHKIEVIGLIDGEVKSARALHPALNFENAKGAAKNVNESKEVLEYDAQFIDTVNVARKGLSGSLYFAPYEIKKIPEAKSSLGATQAASINTLSKEI